MRTIFTYKERIYMLVFIFGILVSTNANAQTKHVVEVSNNVFTPDEVTISAGDTVEWKNIEGYHNVNGTQATYPNNPESFGNSAGRDWTYSYVFTAAGKYDYQCDPHVGLGMTGSVEVLDNGEENKHLLTINFSSMNPHDGQKLYLRVVDKDSGVEVERKVEDINASFTVQASGIEKDHSYLIDFFADHNGNGMYDVPPTDHAWRLELNNVTGDTTLNFSHHANFTNINWLYKLMVNFSGMNPHDDQTFHFMVIEEESGTEVYRTQTTVTPSFSLSASVLEGGKSYRIDFYSDHNGNGMYDAPSTDHAWRLELSNVTGDTTLNFTHNINFTNISTTTDVKTIKDLFSRIYPNPADEVLHINFESLSGKPAINIYDLTGKMHRTKTIQQLDNRTTIDVSGLTTGIYILEIKQGETRIVHKIIKK